MQHCLLNKENCTRENISNKFGTRYTEKLRTVNTAYAK